MRASIIFLFLVGLLTAAPASYDARIIERMNKRYDLQAVSAFLKRTIQERPAIEGVAVSKSRISDSWRFEAVDPPSRMRSGDWVIWDRKDEEESFDLYYRFDAAHTLTLRVKRLGRDKFEFAWSSIDEWVTLQ